MSDTIVVGYDGSDSSDATVEFAIDLARTRGSRVFAVHVLEWSPYSFLTPEEIEERHKRRKDELDRARAAFIDPVVARIKSAGIDVEGEVRYGHIAETLLDIAKEKKAIQIVVGRTGHSSISTRLFGSVAGTLAQAAPVPVTIVP